MLYIKKKYIKILLTRRKIKTYVGDSKDKSNVGKELSLVSVDTKVFEKASAFIWILVDSIIKAMKHGEFRMELHYDPKLQNVKIEFYDICNKHTNKLEVKREDIMDNLFKLFFVCPACEKPIVSKEEMVIDAKRWEESNYCGKCGAKIASTYKEALAIATKDISEFSSQKQ